MAHQIGSLRAFFVCYWHYNSTSCSFKVITLIVVCCSPAVVLSWRIFWHSPWGRFGQFEILFSLPVFGNIKWQHSSSDHTRMNWVTGLDSHTQKKNLIFLQFLPDHENLMREGLQSHQFYTCGPGEPSYKCREGGEGTLKSSAYACRENQPQEANNGQFDLKCIPLTQSLRPNVRPHLRILLNYF